MLRLNVANLLTQDDLEEGDWRISWRKWMFRFELFYCWFNLIIGVYLVYQVIRFNDFGFLIKLAGILNFSTFLLVCYNGWFFQRSLKGKFSGSYIRNVSTLPPILQIPIKAKNKKLKEFSQIGQN